MGAVTGVPSVEAGRDRLAAIASASEVRLERSAFPLLDGATRRSTKRPTHSSVPGYVIGPIDIVILAMQSIS